MAQSTQYCDPSVIDRLTRLQDYQQVDSTWTLIMEGSLLYTVSIVSHGPPPPQRHTRYQGEASTVDVAVLAIKSAHYC